jgi:hypothetical protein
MIGACITRETDVNGNVQSFQNAGGENVSTSVELPGSHPWVGSRLTHAVRIQPRDSDAHSRRINTAKCSTMDCLKQPHAYVYDDVGIRPLCTRGVRQRATTSSVRLCRCRQEPSKRWRITCAPRCFARPKVSALVRSVFDGNELLDDLLSTH